jgi:hypothetical protein
VAQTVSRPRPLPVAWPRAGYWLRILGIGLRIVVPLAALWLEGWPALLGAIVIQEAGLWLARRIASDPALGGALFLGAYGLRAAVAIPLHAYMKARNGSGAVFQDDATYDLVSAWLVRTEHGDGIAIFSGHKHLLDSLYPYVLAGIYAVLGYTPLVPKLLNGVLAALTAVLIMEIGWRAFSHRAGLVAGVGFALLPSLVLYSSVSLKEPLLLLGVVIALRAIQELDAAPLRSASFANALVALAFALLLVDDLRAPLVVLVCGLTVLTLLRRSRQRLRTLQVVFVFLLGAGLVGGVVLVARIRSPESALAQATHLDYVVEQLNHRRAWEAFSARSQLETPADPYNANGRLVPPQLSGDSPNDTLDVGDILTPFGFALLSPTPWQVRSLRDLAASGEMLIWYVLLAAALCGWRARPQQPAFVVCLVLYGLATWAALAVSEGNLGNLLRHRMMLTPTVLVLGAAGGVWVWERLQPSRLRRASLTVQPAYPCAEVRRG